jgi:hypothetical protein
MNPMDAVDELLPPRAVAKILLRPLGWLAKARMTGAGPRFLKVGGRVLYRRSALNAWLAERERASTAS